MRFRLGSVVIGEAMLTMNPDGHKRAIVSEAYRLLKSGGRYGIHELAIRPDDIAPEVRAEIETALSSAMHVGARPLAAAEWRALLNDVGFDAGVPQLGLIASPKSVWACPGGCASGTNISCIRWRQPTT